MKTGAQHPERLRRRRGVDPRTARRTRTALIGAWLWACAPPLGAHHVAAAKFDPERPVRFEGRVTKVDWANPHVHVFVDVEAPGGVANWAIELESRASLEASGWRADTLALGEPVTVDGWAARDGSLQAWSTALARSGTDARLFETTDPVAASVPFRETPRWPDGQPRLGPVPGETGYWGNPTATALVEVGADVEVSPDGILADLGDAPAVAPFQDWALALYEARQRDFLGSDPSFLRCIPPGGPRQFQLPYGVQFVEQRDRERIFVLVGSGNRNWHFIYTDGRVQVGQITGDDDNPLYYGRSVGAWEGDTLVVDTRGFNEDFWFSNGGLPHTERLHLIQRITRVDFDTLRYEVTIDDAGAYTRPWTAGWNLEWIAGRELPVYFCQDNRP